MMSDNRNGPRRGPGAISDRLRGDTVQYTPPGYDVTTPNHQEVLNFLRRLGVRPAGVIAGDPDWCDLPDEVNDKIDAVLVAGARWCLETELDAIVARRQAEKDAAIEASRALDWAATARRIRQRDEWLRSNPWAVRRTA